MKGLVISIFSMILISSVQANESFFFCKAPNNKKAVIRVTKFANGSCWRNATITINKSLYKARDCELSDTRLFLGSEGGGNTPPVLLAHLSQVSLKLWKGRLYQMGRVTCERFN
jgi:hypothetical protein